MNRFYLLLSILAAFILPALSISVSTPTVAEGLSTITLPEVIAGNGSAQGADLSIWHLILMIYIIGVAFFFIKIVKSLKEIFSIAKTPDHEIGRVKVYKITDLPSFSFLNYIFLNKNNCEDEVMKQVLQHELVHVKQLHSIDILFVEVVQAVLWFNPLLKLYKNEFKAVHEFKADKVAVKSIGTDHFEYGKLLLNQLVPHRKLQLAHLFSNNHIKTRIIMLSKKRTTSILKSIYLLALPMFALAVLLFSCEGIIEQKEVESTQAKALVQSTDQPYKVVEQMPEYPGGKEALMTYMGSNLNYPENAKSDKVEGTVYVSFIITNKGKVENVHVTKGVNEALDAEAVRVIKDMQNWTPGYHKGKAVDVEMVLPVKFKLQ